MDAAIRFAGSSRRSAGCVRGLCAFLLLVSCLVMPAPGWVDDRGGAVMLTPTAEHRQASRAVVRTIDNHEGRMLWFKDTLGAQVLEHFIQAWDPDRDLLHMGDISAFSRGRSKIGVALRNGDLAFAFDLFHRVRARFDERTAYAIRLLDGELDFESGQRRFTGAERANWATDRATLQDRWARTVLDDAIDLALSGHRAGEIRETLRTRYIRLRIGFGRFDADDVAEQALNAYVRANDRYGAYFSTEAAERGQMQARNALEGIGVVVRQEGRHAAITQVLPGGPAERSRALGIDDRILGIGQRDDPELVDVVGWPIADVVERLRGAPGTIVRLRILPAGEAVPRIVALRRARIVLENRVARGWIVPPGHAEPNGPRIGVIELPSFYVGKAAGANRGAANASDDVRRIIRRMRSVGIDGLVLDLRRNQGGSLQQAVRTAGLFIGGGPIVQVRSHTGKIQAYEDPNPAAEWNGALAVLVGSRSASAAEIVAAALQDYRRGVIVGEQTYGKGSAQSVILLERQGASGAVKLTTSYWFRITGGNIDSRGINPDIDLSWAAGPEQRGTRVEPASRIGNGITATTWSALPANEDVIALLGSRSRGRIEADPAFRALRKEVAESNLDRANAGRSLRLSERRMELERQLRRRAAVVRLLQDALVGEGTGASGLAAERLPDLRAAMILREAVRIAADLARTK